MNTLSSLLSSTSMVVMKSMGVDDGIDDDNDDDDDYHDSNLKISTTSFY